MIRLFKIAMVHYKVILALACYASIAISVLDGDTQRFGPSNLVSNQRATTSPVSIAASASRFGVVFSPGLALWTVEPIIQVPLTLAATRTESIFFMTNEQRRAPLAWFFSSNGSTMGKTRIIFSSEWDAFARAVNLRKGAEQYSTCRTARSLYDVPAVAVVRVSCASASYPIAFCGAVDSPLNGFELGFARRADLLMKCIPTTTEVCSNRYQSSRISVSHAPSMTAYWSGFLRRTNATGTRSYFSSEVA